MTARLLLSGHLTAPITRRNRRVDGRVFGVATVADEAQGEPCAWTVFVNNLELIERFERLKLGEPIAISGPFTVKLSDQRIIHRITAEAIIGARKERKKRAKGEAAAIDASDAPADEETKGFAFDDALPF
jgi:hypothetical protein